MRARRRRTSSLWARRDRVRAMRRNIRAGRFPRRVRGSCLRDPDSVGELELRSFNVTHATSILLTSVFLTSISSFVFSFRFQLRKNNSFAELVFVPKAFAEVF